MMINGTPAAVTRKPQGRGSKKPATPSRDKGKRQAPIRPMPTPREGKQSETLTNMFQLMKGSPMQVSEQGVPYKVIAGDPTEDPGYLRPPTRQDIEYGGRLQKAMEQKETGVYPMGWDPVTAEQRITAAERQPHGPGWRKDIIDPLRREQYGPSTLQNVGGFLKGAISPLGKVAPFAYLPGGAVSRTRGLGPNLALPMRRGDIKRGEGTAADQARAFDRAEAEYKHKYYGTPEPGPREPNVYDELGMPQPKEAIPSYDVGQRDVPSYLREMGLRAEQELGPYKVPPPGSDLGLPAGALITRGLSTAPYLKQETRDLIRGGFPVQDLPPGIQRFVKNTLEKPQTFFDLSGGRKGGTKGEEGKKKETFNLLKFLLGLLGLPLKVLGLDVNQGEGGGKQPRRALPAPPSQFGNRVYGPTSQRMIGG